MSLETVQAQISAGIERIRLEGAVPTMRLALQTYREVYFGTPIYGLTPSDKRAMDIELQRVDWLLTEIFPEEVIDG